jgi:porphobilinogen synthase
MSFPATRLRRLRKTGVLRGLVRETEVSAAHLVSPMFVTTSREPRTPIGSLPGVDHLSIDGAVEEAGIVAGLGIPAVLLFGLPAAKDDEGSGAWDDEGVIQLATRAIKVAHPDLLVITDVCLCEYTSHGHCGVLRAALDEHGLAETPILSYSTKYASAFYGPFREAAGSTPSAGDRRGYQLDPANAREGVREALIDVEEGADMLVVKPALPYLDVLRRVRDAVDVPLAAYNVSGEYAMIKAAAAQGLLDERAAVLEILTSIRRAGADIVITYHAKDAARWLS